MATSKDYKNYIVEQLSILDNIICRPMMGEYLLYYCNILFGGIYDERLLIKITKTNQKYNLPKEIPYKGAKEMYLIDDIEDQDLLKEIIIETCNGLPKK